ncbi:MAG: SRPBCC domain-containing protein [Bacteroidota bacterium]
MNTEEAEFEKVHLKFLEKNKVRFRCSYQVSRERLWNAISQPGELNRWFMKTEWDFRKGGRFSLEGGWDGWIEDIIEFRFIEVGT